MLDKAAQDKEQIKRWAEIAANAGEADAGYWLGTYYEEKKELELAFKNYHTAAAQNSAPAQLAVGRFYEKGIGGCGESLEEAIHYYQLAANQKFVAAYYPLGCLYEKNKDYELAVENYELAMEKTRRPEAFYKAALCYEKGCGVEENLKIAGELYIQAYEAYSVEKKTGPEELSFKLIEICEKGLISEKTLNASFSLFGSYPGGFLPFARNNLVGDYGYKAGHFYQILQEFKRNKSHFEEAAYYYSCSIRKRKYEDVAQAMLKPLHGLSNEKVVLDNAEERLINFLKTLVSRDQLTVGKIEEQKAAFTYFKQVLGPMIDDAIWGKVGENLLMLLKCLVIFYPVALAVNYFQTGSLFFHTPKSKAIEPVMEIAQKLRDEFELYGDGVYYGRGVYPRPTENHAV